MLRYITLSVLLAGISLSVLAQKDSSQRFSLKEAVEFAKRNNRALQNMKLDESNAKARVKQTLADGLPQVNGNVGFNNNFELQPFYFNLDPSAFLAFIPGADTLPKSGGGGGGSVTRAGAKITGSASLTASQLLFDGTYLLGLKAAREYVKLSQQLSAQSEIETETNVAKAYFLALITQENIRLVENNLKQVEKTWGEVKALYQNGFAEKIDADRLELSYRNLQIQRNKLADQQMITQQLLKMHMGMDVNQPIELTDKLDNLYQVNGMQSSANEKPNFSNRIEYKLLDQQVRLNELNLKRWKTGYVPTVSAMFNYSLNSFQTSFSPYTSGKAPWYSSSFLGIKMDIPIFDGFRKQSLIQQSRIELSKLQNNRKDLENSISLQTSQAQLSYNTALQQLDLQQKNVKLAEDIYRVTTAKYKQGVGSTLELSSAETEMKSAQVNYLNAVFELLSAKIELNKALGKNILN